MISLHLWVPTYISLIMLHWSFSQLLIILPCPSKDLIAFFFLLSFIISNDIKIIIPFICSLLTQNFLLERMWHRKSCHLYDNSNTHFVFLQPLVQFLRHLCFIQQSLEDLWPMRQVAILTLVLLLPLSRFVETFYSHSHTCIYTCNSCFSMAYNLFTWRI